MPGDEDNQNRMLGGLKCATPSLNLLKGRTILNIRFDESFEGKTASQLIAESFDCIASAGRKTARVATSKMMHAAINRELFVPWDGAIIAAYGSAPGCGRHYAEKFLPRIQRLAKRAIRQVIEKKDCSCEEAISYLTSRRHSLAKVLDEYNWMKYTQGDDCVWQAEEE